MEIRRIVPNIGSNEPEKCRAFYADFLGMRLAMDMGWIATYVSPTNPTAQVSIVRGPDSDASGKPEKQALSISIEVEDVDRLHTEAVARGYKIVYPLSDESFGVRRFAVADPNGVVINIMRHTRPSG
jgi:catechol 2,3-dioxygenase-like lactoylglutathione lyase family enzyme